MIPDLLRLFQKEKEEVYGCNNIVWNIVSLSSFFQDPSRRSGQYI